MIKSISVKDFRGVSRIYEFGQGANVLIGPNEARKSTIGEAICFAYYGVDSSGSKNPEHLISFDKTITEVAVSTDKATVVRKKKRGSQTQGIKLVRDGMPEVTMTQAELTALLGIDFDVFASAAFAGYFMKQTPQKKLEIVSKVFKCDRVALFHELAIKFHGHDLDIPSVVKFDNVKASSTYVATERRRVQNVMAAENGRVMQIDSQLASCGDTVATSYNVGELQAEINKLSARESLLLNHWHAVNRYNSEKAAYQASLLKYDNAMAEKKSLELELSSISPMSEVELNAIYDDILKMDVEISRLRQKIQHVPPEPAKPRQLASGTACSACGQVVSDKAVKSVQAAYEAEVVAYNDRCRNILDSNNSVNEKIESLSVARTTKRSKWEEGRTARSSAASIEARLSRLSDLKDPEVPEAPKPPAAGLSLEETRAKISEAHTALAKAKVAGEAATRLKMEKEKILETIKELSSKIKYFEEVEAVLNSILEEESMRTIQAMQIPGGKVSVMEGDVVFTDEKGCPYTSLSTGRRGKADIEFCKVIQRSINRPGFYFIDNEDLIDDVKPHLPTGKDDQVFLARVDKSLKELEIRSL